MSKENLIAEFTRIGAIKHGDFTLKSGAKSSIYVDLRAIISYPILLKQVTALLWKKSAAWDWDVVCGVPYTALPLATTLSILYEKPMVLRRKEAKDYGTKKMIEGVYQPGQSCLVIEDVVTTGTSILETIKDLEEAGLKVKNIVAILDREQGAKQILRDRGYEFSSLLTLNEIV
ncbi:MAG: orotate phosphoribosyltransferase [Gammaproteobacteria bacterium]